MSGMSSRTAAEIQRFRAEESTDGIVDLSKMTLNQRAAWAEQIRAESAKGMERLRREGEEKRKREAAQAQQEPLQREAARKADQERARQQSQQVLMNGVRAELVSIFNSATAAEWDRATDAVKAQGLIGTLLAPDAYRLALQEIRRK